MHYAYNFLKQQQIHLPNNDNKQSFQTYTNSKQFLSHIRKLQLFQQIYKKSMKLLQQEMEFNEMDKYKMGAILNSVFQSKGMHGTSSLNPCKTQYYTNIYLIRAQKYLSVIWQYKISQKIIGVDLQLDNSTYCLNRNLIQFLKDHQEEIHQFIYQINNLTLTNLSTYFIFNQTTGQIILRYKITKFRFLSSKSTLIRYFNRCIQHATNLFIQEIQNILFYYKLPGFSLVELEQQAQSVNYVPLRQQRETILLMQKYFSLQKMDKNAQNRSHIPSTDKIPALKAVNSILLNGNNQIPLYENKNSISQLLKYQIQTLLLDINNKKEGAQLILTSIIIKQKSKQALLGTGGYASIIHGIYSYIPEISIYSNLISPQIQIVDQQAIIKNCSLVKKVSIQNEEGKVNIPLQNQCHFLTYMRNKVCPYIAKYYCNSNLSGPFSDGEIYLQYYPNNLAQSHLNQQKKMKVMQDVCLALLFLNEEKMIHRDIKEVNIMVDKYHRARLIDFGSVASINGSHRFQTKDQKIRSTPGYYLPYQDAVALYPKIEQNISKHDYYTHETYDLYGLGRIIESQLCLTNFIDSNHFVRYNLKYLCDKCREVNPEDRWNIQQVLVFLRHLMKFSEMRKQFWKRGFDARYRAHQLGKHYNGNGGYLDRCEKTYFNTQTGAYQRQQIQNYLPK